MEVDMTRVRKTLVSLEATPYYHRISRCVHRAWICGNNPYAGNRIIKDSQKISENHVYIAYDHNIISIF
jgi:hypothetical protein